MTYVLVWLAVTATAVFVAAAAVGSVRNQVTETPTAMIPTTSTTTGAAPDTSSPASTAEASFTTTTSAALTTATTLPSTTTTTRPTEPAPSMTTTTAPATTATTSPPVTDIRSYDLVGGVVTVEVGSDAVHLAGASPKPGFSMNVEDSGPESVEVEFRSDDHESKFSGEFSEGRFVSEIEEGDHDDD